uniref:Proteoglycan 4-like isoform X2 n=1 Tax=Crassostrea virginica TaxID=6565 RepID=A0A8B8ERL9_CRAVI|nr:proteoglycan 4-like isoform X2 [Crassostrea virginica]
MRSNVNYFTSIIAVVVHIQFCYSSYSCPKSTPTISYVKSCPKNKSEWDSAANRKQCNSIADDLKCATPTSNFKYHCLLNRWRNATLEVCTSVFHLQGYCAVYDTQLHRVAENYETNFECLKFPEDERCPSRYPSTDAYKYQMCYTNANLEQKITTSTTTTTTIEATETKATAIRESRPDGNDGVKIAFLVILSVVVIGLLSFILWKHGPKNCPKVNNCRDVEAAGEVPVTNDETALTEQTNSIQKNTPESVQTCKPGATGEPSERNNISSGEDEKEPLLPSKGEDSLHVTVEKNNTFVQTYKGPASVASSSDKAAFSQSSNIQSSNISDEKAPATITLDTDSSTKSGDKIPSSRLVKEVQSPILADKCADDTDDLSVTALTSDGKPLSKQRDNGLKTSTPDDVSVLSPKPTPDTQEDPTSTLQSVDTKTTRQNEVQDSKSNDKLNPSLNNSKEEASTLKSVDTKTTRQNEVQDSKSNDKLNPSLNNSKEEASTLKSVDNQATREKDDVPDSKSNEELNPSLNNSKEGASTLKSVDNKATREKDDVPDSKSNEELNPSLNNSKEGASTLKSVDNQATREKDDVPDSKSNEELNPSLNNLKEGASTLKSVDNKATREKDDVPDSKSNEELNPSLNNSKEEASTLKSVDNKATRENNEVPDFKPNEELNPSLNNSKEGASTLKSVDNKATREKDEIPDSKSIDELNPFFNNSEEEASPFKSVDKQTTRGNDEIPDSKSIDELNPFFNDSKSDLLSTSDSLPPKTSNDGAKANAKELPLNEMPEKESALGKNRKKAPAPPRPNPPSRSTEIRKDPIMKKMPAPPPPPPHKQ